MSDPHQDPHTSYIIDAVCFSLKKNVVPLLVCQPLPYNARESFTSSLKDQALTQINDRLSEAGAEFAP